MSPSWFTMFFRDFVNPAEVFSDYAFAITSYFIIRNHKRLILAGLLCKVLKVSPYKIQL